MSSIVDKVPSRCSSGAGIDPSLPEWKRDLILKKRAMNRTFPFRLSSSVNVNEHGRTSTVNVNEHSRPSTANVNEHSRPSTVNVNEHGRPSSISSVNEHCRTSNKLLPATKEGGGICRLDDRAGVTTTPAGGDQRSTEVIPARLLAASRPAAGGSGGHPLVAVTEVDTRDRSSFGHTFKQAPPSFHVESNSSSSPWGGLPDASRAWLVAKKSLGGGGNSNNNSSGGVGAARNETRPLECQQKRDSNESLAVAVGYSVGGGAGVVVGAGGDEVEGGKSRVATRTSTIWDQQVKMGEDKGSGSSCGANATIINNGGCGVAEVGLTTRWLTSNSRESCRSPPTMLYEENNYHHIHQDGGQGRSALEKWNENVQQDGGQGRSALGKWNENVQQDGGGDQGNALGKWNENEQEEFEQEFEYGPGIVNRLRSKFIRLTSRDGATLAANLDGTSYVPIRRVASLEHLLDSDGDAEPDDDQHCRGGVTVSRTRNRHSSWGKRTSSAAQRSKADVMKRARSMETLSAVGYGGFKSTFLRGFSRNYMPSSATFPPLSPVNDNVIIIEQPRPPKSPDDELASKVTVPQSVGRKSGGHGTNNLLDDDELPKPDTVRTFKKLFESSTLGSDDAGSGIVAKKEPSGGQIRKVTPPSPKPPGLRLGPKPAIPVKPAIFAVPPKLTHANNRALDNNKTLVCDVSQNYKREEPSASCGDQAEVVVIQPRSPTTTTSLGLVNGLVNGEVSGVDALAGHEPDVDNGPLASPVSWDTSGFDDPTISSPSQLQQQASWDSHSDDGPSSVSPRAGGEGGGVPTVDPGDGGMLWQDTAAIATGPCPNDAPKVVSLQPKLEDRDRPVGHIRPFPKVEEHDVPNVALNTSSLAASVEDSPGAAGAVTALHEASKILFGPRKGPGAPSHGPVTQTFNFVGNAQVQPHIANHTAPFDFRRPVVRSADRVTSTNRENLSSMSGAVGPFGGSYIIVDDDRLPFGLAGYSDDEDGGAGLDSGEEANFVFVGDNVVAGRSALIKTRNKKLKIAFDDKALSTYEYPSESSLLDSESLAYLEDKDKLKPHPVGFGSPGGLDSYTPKAFRNAPEFKLGDSRSQPAVAEPASDSPLIQEREESNFLDDPHITVKPAPDDQTTAFTMNTETSDMLF